MFAHHRYGQAPWITIREPTVANDNFPATAWNNGRWHASGAGYGLKISVADRDLFFRREWRTVTLQLVGGCGVADVEVNCDKNSFWNGTCRELVARDIGRWLLHLGLAPWPKGRPPRFNMSPTATGVFRVEPQPALV